MEGLAVDLDEALAAVQVVSVFAFLSPAHCRCDRKGIFRTYALQCATAIQLLAHVLSKRHHAVPAKRTSCGLLLAEATRLVSPLVAIK